MSVDINHDSNSTGVDYAKADDAPQARQDMEQSNPVSPEVSALIQSQANLINRVKLLTGLLIGAILLSLGSIVWAGRQAEPQIIADQSVLEAPSEQPSDEAAAQVGEVTEIKTDEEPETAQIDGLNVSSQEPAKIARKIAELEQQIQNLASETPGNMATQVTETNKRLATVAASLGRAEEEILNLRNLTSALQQAVNRQLEAPVPEPTQPAPDSLPSSLAVPDSP